MSVAVERKQEVIESYARKDGDTGSPEVQVALLTSRIKHLTEHGKQHRHDHASRRGLVMMVGKRNRHLRYLSRTNHGAYQTLIKRLGLRK